MTSIRARPAIALSHLPVGDNRKGPRLRDEIVECSRLATGVGFPVSACNSYINSTHPTMREMEDVAWVLRSDPRRNQIGFVAPGKLKAHERYVLPDEWD